VVPAGRREELLEARVGGGGAVQGVPGGVELQAAVAEDSVDAGAGPAGADAEGAHLREGLPAHEEGDDGVGLLVGEGDVVPVGGDHDAPRGSGTAGAACWRSWASLVASCSTRRPPRTDRP